MIEYRMRLICDGCGQVLEEADKVKVTNLDHQRWVWRDKWTDHLEVVRVEGCKGFGTKGKVETRFVKGTGVVEIPRAHRTTLHYCTQCADGRA